MKKTILLIIVAAFVFVIVMTIILNFVEKDRILLMATFFEKVLPKILFSKMLLL